MKFQHTLIEEPERSALPTAGELKKTSSHSLVAAGLQRESAIALYRLNYNGTPQASVFVYPWDYRLNQGKIIALDYAFTDINPFLALREFKDTSIEDLNQLFLNTARRIAIPFFSHNYSDAKYRIFENSFNVQLAVHLKDIIAELKN